MDEGQKAEYIRILTEVEEEERAVKELANADDDQVSQFLFKWKLDRCATRKWELNRVIAIGEPIICSTCRRNPLTVTQLKHYPFATECQECRSKKLIRHQDGIEQAA